MGEISMMETGGSGARLYIAGADGPGVLVLHPWWGLNEDVIAYANRLAGAGFVVVAPDMFDGQVATTIGEAERLAHAADENAVNAIVLAALDRLIELAAPSTPLAALGFSFGAHWAMWSPTQRDRVVASVVYYGTTDGPVLARASVPVLGHFAEDDPYETAEWVAEFEETLRAAGREVLLHRYPGTGHWFAEPSREAYRPDAAELAFTRTGEFLATHLESGRLRD